jgi:hypothetical protein
MCLTKENKILKPFENHPNYNCKITTDDGQDYLVYANWLHNERLDNWQGWHCAAGATRFFINDKLEVWSGECKNDFLGNALTQWTVKTHTVCKRETCTGCKDDLLVTKYQTE